MGTEALGLGGITRVIAPGRRADLILVRADALITVASRDPISLLLRSARPENVDTVMIDGVVHKRGGRLMRVDLEALASEVARQMGAVRRQAGV